MAIRTCVDMIKAALLTAGIGGVGQTPLAEDTNTAFDLLLEVIGMWSRERFMSWRLVEEVFLSTGAQAYLLLDRPPRLESAFARLLSGPPQAGISTAGLVDFPLVIIDSADEYNEIGIKSLTTFPTAIWYSPDYPVGTVYPWPIPAADQFELHVFYRAGLPIYRELTDELALPPEYVRALRYELALLIAINYGQPPNPAFAAILGGTKAGIKAVNAHLAELSMPAGLVPHMPGSGGISGMVAPHQSVIVLNSGNAVLG
jgi:hypothetical protein